MKSVIKKYIERLTEDDIKNYIKNNNYDVTEKEINIIFRYIKNYYEEFLDGDTSILDNLKKEVSPSTYLEIMKLYNKYKKWI